MNFASLGVLNSFYGGSNIKIAYCGSLQRTFRRLDVSRVKNDMSCLASLFTTSTMLAWNCASKNRTSLILDKFG